MSKDRSMNRAISVRAPWAFAITKLGKRIENRTFRTKFPGVLFIHASLTSDAVAEREVRAIAEQFGISAPELFARGAIVARAYLYDIVPESDAKIDLDQKRWARGPWLWLLRNVMPIKPIFVSGKLGVFDPGKLHVVELRASCARPISAKPLQRSKSVR